MNLAQRFSKSFTWQLIGNILGAVMMVLGSILVVRLLGAEKYGSYAVVLSLIQIVKLVISFGHEITINTYLPKFMATGQKDRVAQLLRYIIKRRSLWFIFTALSLFFAARLIARGFQIPDLVLYIKLGIPIIGLEYFTAVFRNIFTAKVHIRGVIKLGIFTQSLNLVLIYLFLSLGYGIPGLLWAVIISDAVSLAVLYYVSAEYLRPPALATEAKAMDIKPIRGYARNIWLQNILAYFLGKQADITLMGLFKIPLASVGCYNIAYELSSKIGFFVSGTGTLLLSSISESHAVSGMAGLRNSWTKLYKVIALAVFPLMVFTAVNCREIITILYTTEMAESITMFFFFVLVYAVTLITGKGLCTTGLYVLNREGAVLKVLFFSGMLNLLLDLVLIPRMGALGAVWATSVSTLVDNFIIAVIFWRAVGFFYPFGFILRLVLGSVLAALPTLWWEAERIRHLALEGIVFLICLILICMVLKLFNEQEKAQVAEINPLFGRVINYF